MADVEFSFIAEAKTLKLTKNIVKHWSKICRFQLHEGGYITYTASQKHPTSSLQRAQVYTWCKIWLPSALTELNNNYNIFITSPPQSHLGRATSTPLTADNGLTDCLGYYLCNAHCRWVHSDVSMLHPHRSASFFLCVTLHCPICPSQKNCPFPLGDTYPSRKKNHPLAHATHHPKHTLNFTAISYVW